MTITGNCISGVFRGAIIGGQVLGKGNNLAGGDPGVDVTCPSNVVDNAVVSTRPGGTALVAHGVGCNVAKNAAD